MRLAPLRPEDRARVFELLVATAAFSSEEVGVALEIFDETFSNVCRPDRSTATEGPALSFPDYEFIGAYDNQQPRGPTICTGSPWTLPRRDVARAER